MFPVNPSTLIKTRELVKFTVPLKMDASCFKTFTPFLWGFSLGLSLGVPLLVSGEGFCALNSLGYSLPTLNTGTRCEKLISNDRSLLGFRWLLVAYPTGSMKLVYLPTNFTINITNKCRQRYRSSHGCFGVWGILVFFFNGIRKRRVFLGIPPFPPIRRHRDLLKVHIWSPNHSPYHPWSWYIYPTFTICYH